MNLPIEFKNLTHEEKDALIEQLLLELGNLQRRIAKLEEIIWGKKSEKSDSVKKKKRTKRRKPLMIL